MTTIWTAAITGLLTGGVASLAAPWIHWGIEKRKMKLKRRLDIIYRVRSYLVTNNYDVFALMQLPLFYEIEALLPKKFIIRLNNLRDNQLEGEEYEAFTYQITNLFLSQLVKLEERIL